MAVAAKPTLLVLIGDVFAPHPDTKYSGSMTDTMMGAALTAAAIRLEKLAAKLSEWFDLAYLVGGRVLVAAPGVDARNVAGEAAEYAAAAVGRRDPIELPPDPALLVARPPDAPPPRLTLALTATRAAVIATVNGRSVARDLGGTLADLGGRDSAASVKLALAAVSAIVLYAGEAFPSP